MKKQRLRIAASASCVGMVSLLACSGGSGTGTSGPGGGPSGPGGAGVCQTTCSQACTSDSDCDLTRGQMCCDLHEAGKTCTAAKDCPVYCGRDSECELSKGYACLRTSLAVPDKTCVSSTSAVGLRTCQGDSDCSSTNVCCTIYKESICLPPDRCPKVCTKSEECDTANSEICCTSANLREPSVTATGLCLDPSREKCPKGCGQSSECSTSANELCCNGVCSKTCLKPCTQSSDCKGQICCKSALMRVQPPTYIFSGGVNPATATCANVMAAFCGWVNRCGGLPALAQIGATSVSECVSLSTNAQCRGSVFGCLSGEVYQADMAAACLKALPTWTCSGFSSADFSAGPSACGRICG